ncbi:unnamed protein product [Diatraea saccharalis]|uniref:BTB domain-containing protein n=1 Tax=Diatraea saccharalis TaxID=40085 RepID=A0A9N9QXU4_9NEOP|nr:unnamed protein product [Diatraea saccharalis]
MTQTKLSLAWQSFRNNICEGLSSFQQREEFVDMTLAADGHLVKVHQMVLSLASPYLKELIKSAPCPHPILFLNQISYPILCSILEYIYSGEVVVNKDDIGELIQAGKALHIKGFEVMDLNNTERGDGDTDQMIPSSDANDLDVLPSSVTIARKRKFNDDPIWTETVDIDKGDHNNTVIIPQTNMDEDYLDSTGLDESFEDHTQDRKEVPLRASIIKSNVPSGPTVQYTLSNQGNLQIILNRYMYNLAYVYKNTSPPARLWKCVDVKSKKCKASVTTKDDVVVQRVGAHKHPFHDKKILRKVENNIVRTAIKDAENMQNRTDDTDGHTKRLSSESQ